MNLMRGLSAVLRLLRPLQWTKNLLVLAALLFAGQAGDPGQLARALLMAAAFCLASSAQYALNDVLDRRVDRRHPSKRRRPVAAGELSTGAALWVALALAAGAWWMATPAPAPARACLVGYLGLGACYSAWLKRVAILDILVIAAGFVLRAAAGALAIDVEISPWLLICTQLLALFLAAAKRRHELVRGSGSRGSRPVLAAYSTMQLDQMIAVTASATLMAYVLYAFAERTREQFPSGLMPLTIPFVLYGLFRYLHLVYRRAEGGEPEVLVVRDVPLLLAVVLYAVTVLAVVEP